MKAGMEQASCDVVFARSERAQAVKWLPMRPETAQSLPPTGCLSKYNGGLRLYHAPLQGEDRMPRQQPQFDALAAVVRAAIATADAT